MKKVIKKRLTPAAKAKKAFKLGEKFASKETSTSKTKKLVTKKKTKK